MKVLEALANIAKFKRSIEGATEAFEDGSIVKVTLRRQFGVREAKSCRSFSFLWPARIPLCDYYKHAARNTPAGLPNCKKKKRRRGVLLR